MRTTLLTFSSLSLIVLSCVPATSQQTTGVPGSPSATTTIDGRYLPAPPAPFGGEINLNAAQSKSYWPPRVVPPKGAPNILLIMTDDVGFGAWTFSGAPTVHTVSLAAGNYYYSVFGNAAGVAAYWGLLLTPAVGAVLMSASTVIVAINAKLLGRDGIENARSR